MIRWRSMQTLEETTTVAVDYNDPLLFTIAEDLVRMELQVDVDEADVGQVQTGWKR
jgi:HlyD family secretion protein